ncbi:MAG: phosphotransferase [Rhodospirillales bacterium]|nr:phosphotransferase [Rhodospirillales bacterium]
MTAAGSRRDRGREAFLRAAGWGRAERRLLAADASFRQYDRLQQGGLSAVLMDALPDKEPGEAFLTVAAILREMGLSAPRVLAADTASGFVLLEDLGDTTFSRLLAEGADEARLYRLAIDLLVALQRRWHPCYAARLQPYDEARLLAEVRLLVDWYLPAVSGRPTEPAVAASYLQAWRGLLTGPAASREVLVLRDYHIDNLLCLPDRSGVAACGLLDFQDALLGPAAYDLVSLLQDARRDIAPDLAEAMRQRWQEALPERDPAADTAAYACLGVQRSVKIAGIFTRLDRRDGKSRYLAHLPRVFRLIRQGLAEPALAPLAAWFDRHLPLADPVLPQPDPGRGVPQRERP